MSNKVERKNAAYHEAGHVVIAWYYNIRSFGVSIAKNKDTSGKA